ncbi:hypothetical protein AXG93_1543s1630 [Marchantia polymorpha subsp. ruderalis]|uniref:Uncharacterized protein n=1 Tax=Marchantia polymorpha subsp. ruderalis TaxID=1480154 RepID=A0A176W030_MARPO|nr:hypothetical protein AXG93_1543s1630 [Marchantia polymorpha subsp. ruderalis]
MSHIERLVDKVAIITGGARGIGLATCKLFNEHGAKVIIADVNEEHGRAAALQLGPSVLYKRTDVTLEAEIQSTVEFAVKEFGKLDIMFNNAGVITPPDDKLENLDLIEYDRYTSIMVRGVLCGIKHAARAMIPRRSGVILTTASVAAVMTGPDLPLIYNLNKHALPGITKIAAFHLGGKGIRVNCISPHSVPTGMVIDYMQSLGREVEEEKLIAGYTKKSPLLDKHCTREDIAAAALFLCSNDSNFISGQNLVVDAGFCNFKIFGSVED